MLNLGSTSINWDTVVTSVLASALTAVFVTLAVEYLAKPRLEARKERFLQYHKTRRDGRRHLLKVRELSVRLSQYRRLSDATSSNRDSHREIYARFNSELAEAIEGFDQAFTDVSPDVPSRFYEATTGYVGLVLGVVRSDQPWARKGAAIALATYPMIDAWDTPTARGFLWSRRMRKLEQAIAQFSQKEKFEARVDNLVRDKLPN